MISRYHLHQSKPKHKPQIRSRSSRIDNNNVRSSFPKKKTEYPLNSSNKIENESYNRFRDEQYYYIDNRKPYRRDRRLTEYAHRSYHKHHDRTSRSSVEGVELPWDIICNILSRLPIKILMGVMCKSKKCYGLKENPYFICLQLNSALLEQPSYILTDNYYSFMATQPINRLFLVNKGKYRRWKAITIPATKRMQIAGSCNGLLCLCEENPLATPIIIYNPVTQESISLPIVDFVYREHMMNYYLQSVLSTSVAFGFDSLSNKYKVVIICPSNENKNGMEVYIISLLGDDDQSFCWRELNLSFEFQFIQYPHGSYRKSVFFNGYFYWIIQKTNEYVKHILAMNIHDERFEEVDLFIGCKEEDGYDDYDNLGYYLLHFNKYLSLIVYNSYDQLMQIWVKKSTWILDSTHDMLSFLESRRPLSFGHEGFNCRVVGMVGDDGLLVQIFDEHMIDYYNIFSEERKDYLVLYTPGTRKFDLKFLSSTKIPTKFDVVAFVPSLVSLKF